MWGYIINGPLSSLVLKMYLFISTTSKVLSTKYFYNKFLDICGFLLNNDVQWIIYPRTP